MVSSRNTSKFVLRLPPDLRQWIADEAVHSLRSMNAVVIEAVGLLMESRAEERRGHKHAAAVLQAIASGALVKGAWACIIIKPDLHAMQTELLIQKPGEDEPIVFACVRGENIEMVGDVAK